MVLVFAAAVPIASAASPAESTTVRQHADRAFERLDQALSASPSLQAATSTPAGARLTTFPPEQFLIGKGQGDLSKGRVTCQRVAELAARSDLAKQIRVLIKEHAIDRTRERTGQDTVQELEVTREEIVQEYLQGVKIIERHVDETVGSCSATAVMPRASPAVAPLGGTQESKPVSPQ
ncbi:hypothetical protein YTPLAS18_35130 [Nitrospira sp.]|nr:hypothetical protein YTPLAS18_35130 [Nitrospira sp.]